jgi:hypothetical protein
VKIILLAATFFVAFQARPQSPVGLWEATRVTVGEKAMTPMGKWTRIKDDGTYQSGNGWVQNSEGKWSFDVAKAFYVSHETNGLIDPYGGFKVSFDNGNMIWHRDEDGLRVVVTWSSIENLPRTPADLIVGMWEIDAEPTVTQPTGSAETKHLLFIRWDRIYVDWDKALEKRYGYWFINAHRPELTFISMTGSALPDAWRVDVDEVTLTLTGISEANKDALLSFRRIHHLPD